MLPTIGATVVANYANAPAFIGTVVDRFPGRWQAGEHYVTVQASGDLPLPRWAIDRPEGRIMLTVWADGTYSDGTRVVTVPVAL